jgi:hypothetical protein
MWREDPGLSNQKVKLIPDLSPWHVVASLMLVSGRRNVNEIESGVGCIGAGDGVGHDACDGAG